MTSGVPYPEESLPAVGVRACAVALAVVVACGGCESIRNGWLDPTILGNFEDSGPLAIRSSLALDDTPFHIIPGASPPTLEDMEEFVEDPEVSPGDTLVVEVFELRQRQTPFQAQVVVSATGFVNLPVVGRIRSDGLTVKEIEDAIGRRLRDREILVDPQVTVNPVSLQKATYSIFGIGASAAFNAPLRSGTFPIRRPDVRLLEAINLVGGLNEFVTEVYLFRTYVPPNRRPPRVKPAPEPADGAGPFDPVGVGIEGLDGMTAPNAPWEHDAPRGAPVLQADNAYREPPSQDDEIDALINAVIEESPDTDASALQPESEVPADLVPDPTAPYIYVNGEFVRNPAYDPIPPDPQAPIPFASVYDSPAPAVNWARLAGESDYRIIMIDAERLRIGDPDANIYVRPGDAIRIVSGEIGEYYVMGQVNRVGVFRFNAEPITLKAAIAAAGGLSNLAWPDRCTVYRRIGSREQMLQVNLDRVFAGKDPDFFIKRGDIINVGTHPLAPFLQRLRAWTLPNPTANVGYSFTYTRNFADIDSFGVRLNPNNERGRFR